MRKTQAVGAWLLSTIPVWAVSADTMNIGASHDNTLYQDATGALSNGAGEFFFVGNTNALVTRRGLIMFDIAAAVPAGATINSASLTLHMSMSNFGATDVALHRALQAWGEGASDAVGGEGVGAPAAPGDATWLHTFFNTSLWTNPGGDFAAAASAVQSVNAVGFYTWASTGLTADVQSYLDAPAGNFGWVMLGNEFEIGSSKRFDTRQSLTASFRPVLTIDFTPVPGPATLAAFGFVLAGAVRRRRRC